MADMLNAAGTGNALELRGVTRMFGALAALSDVTLTVKPGERRGVLGSNGAGKTTLFNCVTGDFLPTSGTIRLFGEDVTRFPPHERIRRPAANRRRLPACCWERCCCRCWGWRPSPPI
jgi:branched-chain amino acid transport system ATP-binding protein